jgi:hypothetical protein
MAGCPIGRVTRVVEGVRQALSSHARDCGDRVLGIALHTDDHRELCIAELWGLPVLAWDDMPEGTVRVLCESAGVLIPDVETFKELLDRWTYQLGLPLSPDDRPAA